MQQDACGAGAGGQESAEGRRCTESGQTKRGAVGGEWCREGCGRQEAHEEGGGRCAEKGAVSREGCGKWDGCTWSWRQARCKRLRWV